MSATAEVEVPVAAAPRKRAEKPAKSKTTPKKKLTAAEERAARLAREAQEIARAAGLKSAYLRQDAEAFLKEFRVSRSGQTVQIERKGKESVECKLSALKRFVAKGGEPEIAKAMRTICGDSRLYGKKAGAFVLATLAQEEVA